MKGDRMRISIDDPYVEALGRAAYAFALLEWNAIWCCERMEPKYMHKPGRAKSKKRTAGEIAEDLVTWSKNHLHRSACLPPARKFQRLVKVRNRIVHGKPAHEASIGKDRLFNDGVAWTTAMINDEADNFTECSDLLNQLLHNELQTPSSLRRRGP
jgi:hypothetical protein